MNIRYFLLLAAAALLTGCVSAPQLPVPLAPQSFQAPANRYGVLLTAVPAADTRFPGAGCLLCYAAASMANSSLSAHTKTLQLEDLVTLDKMAGAILTKRGATVSMLPVTDLSKLPSNDKSAPNFTRKDFTSLKTLHKIDKLLVIEIATVGYDRTYSSYFPTSEPKAVVTGSAYIVNLNDNALEWYQPVNIAKASDKTWDEPPTFPGLTNAYFQAIELAKDEILLPLQK